jgi:CubicO group peptidase (beta-lactamase class C family)
MNEPIFRRPELGRLFRHLLAWSLVAVVQFCSGDVRGEADRQEALRAAQRNVRPPFALWGEGVPFPTHESLASPDGAKDVMVHRAGADAYNFLHDSAIVQHKGKLLAAWYSCPRGEMVGESLIRSRRSQDGGRTWSGVETIASDIRKQGIMYVPVAFLSHGGTLYAFITNMKGGPDLVQNCEVFVLNEETNTWISRGFIAGPFLPNCAPQRLADGNFLMAGRVADQPGQKPTIPAVAISSGEDLEKPWSLVRLLPRGKLDDGQRIPCPETTVLVEGRELTAFVRRENANSLVFFSHDNGQTWSGPCEHNFPMASSKIYAGLLSTGQRYLLCNLPTGRYRDLLVIAVSRPGEKTFVKTWKIRDGYAPALRVGPEWSYPCAVEADGNLHVVYTSEKHHCVLTTIPLKSLAADPAVSAAAPRLPASGSPSTEAIPRAVWREIDAGLFPGVVLLVGRPGRVLYHEAFGHARIVPEKVPMQKDCIFDLASVTKVVATATAFGVCVDDGTVRFGMPIDRALPDLSGSGIDPITVDQLATHTSGFDNAKYHGRARGEAMLEQMLHASPQWKPGSRYYYSCLNMILLGRIVEKASGQRLDTFCQSRIFGPLGMRDTAFGPLRPGPRVVPSGAPESGQIEDEQARFAERPVGNAGLFSTANDLARFCEMMLGEGRFGDVRILSPESQRRMTGNQLGPSLPPRGFGWDMDPQSLHRPQRLSEKAYGHSGHTGQSVWIDPEKQVYVIVLTNRNHPQMVGGGRKAQQYQARARIGDAALEFLESEGQLPKVLP